jgi:hypothetical protein
MPPIPTAAILSLSLGATCPKPATACLGTIVIPAATAAVVPMKDLLETPFLFEFFSIIINVLLDRYFCYNTILKNEG